MMARRQSELLEDVSVASRVVDLEFTVGQVCRIAGITKMQLDYWTVRGDIPTQGKKQRLYDSHAVETVMLIKQARDLGLRRERRDRGGQGVPGHARRGARADRSPPRRLTWAPGTRRRPPRRRAPVCSNRRARSSAVRAADS